MTAPGFFVALLVVAIALIVFLLLIVYAHDRPSKSSGTGIAFCAFIFITVGLLGLVKVTLALLHHGVVYATTGYTGTVWMGPWQACAAYTLIFLMGLYLVWSLIRRKRS